MPLRLPWVMPAAAAPQTPSTTASRASSLMRLPITSKACAALARVLLRSESPPPRPPIRLIVYSSLAAAALVLLCVVVCCCYWCVCREPFQDTREQPLPLLRRDSIFIVPIAPAVAPAPAPPPPTPMMNPGMAFRSAASRSAMRDNDVADALASLPVVQVRGSGWLLEDEGRGGQDATRSCRCGAGWRGGAHDVLNRASRSRRRLLRGA